MEAVSSPAVPAREPWWLRLRALSLSTPASRWLALITVVALALRLALVLTVQPDPGAPDRFDDTVYYDASARSLADGHGYRIPRRVEDIDVLPPGTGTDQRALVDTARWPPGYPMVLAGIYFFFGHSLMLARLLNVVLGTITVLLVYKLGCRIADERAGLIGAALLAIYPSHIIFSTLLLTEVIFTFLLVAILLLITVDREQLTLPRVLALGVLTGLAAMVRGEAVLLPAAVGLGWWIGWRSFSGALVAGVVMMAGLLLVFVPWTIRNAVQLDSPIAGTTGAGAALIQAHHPGADGKPDLYIEVQYESEYLDVPYPEREVRLYEVYVEDALEYVREHPGRELQLVGLRARAMFDRDDSGVIWLRLPPYAISERAADILRTLSQTHYLIVTIIAGLSAPLWLSLRHPVKAMLIVITAYYVFLHVGLFIGEARYHVPLMPIIGLWAALGLVFLWDRLPGASRAPGPSAS